MPDKIHLLPDSVANQIAAGEVIQRPASVIKELVENSVDAGADDIRIYIKDAGRTLIQVIDNGQGMSETDTRMAFERHATSKISSASDLMSLHTMGFRGEALPSICAIAQVEVRSKTAQAPIGTHLVISGSRIKSQQPDVCENGTNIMVKNLFFNVPARRKFMKSDSVELSNIMREFERLALVNPGVKMSIDTGGKEIQLRKGTMLQRIGDLWKGSLVEQLIPIDVDTPTVKISGYVTRPEFARRRNALQYFLVNGRNMRHPYFKKAVLNCFNGLIAPDTQPCFFIKFEIDPASIDVNIHPTKDEIKFEEEAVIWSLLTAGIKGALGKNAAVPSIDFESDSLPVEMADVKAPDRLPGYEIPSDYNPFAASVTRNAQPRKNPATDWEKLYEGFMGPKSSASTRSDGVADRVNIETERVVRHESLLPETTAGGVEIGESFQFGEKYIVADLPGRGVAVVDQYRAHLKIIYERLSRQADNRQDVVSQALLFPALLELSAAQEVTLQEAEPTLRAAGMKLEREGGDFVITGTPPGVTADEAVQIVTRVLDALSDSASHYGAESAGDVAESRRRQIIESMARSMAVKRGNSLTAEERRELLSNLFGLPDPSLTPGGRRIYSLLDENAIERLLP